MNLYLFALLDGLHTVFFYRFSDPVLNEYFWLPFISSLFLYAWLGTWVALRETKWTTKTIQSVAAVSFFGYLVVAVAFTIFEDRGFSKMVLILAILYIFYFVLYCLVALTSAFLVKRLSR